MGAALARAEMESAFEVLLENFGGFSPAWGDQPPPITPSFFGRNLESLGVVLAPRDGAYG